MAVKSYILTQTFKSPCVQVTGVAHKPQQIRFKTFQKGEIVRGELKHANNQPAFVLVAGALVIPVSVLKEVTTADINKSGADGSGSSSSSAEKPKTIKMPSVDRVKIIDGVFLGALVGVGGAFLAEKQKWLPFPEKKNKIIGAAIGAAIGVYIVYRIKAYKKEKTKDE